MRARVLLWSYLFDTKLNLFSGFSINISYMSLLLKHCSSANYGQHLRVELYAQKIPTFSEFFLVQLGICDYLSRIRQICDKDGSQNGLSP